MSTRQLAGQTVVVIGGSADIGLETVRRAREESAEVVISGRSQARLDHAAAEVGARELAELDDMPRALPLDGRIDVRITALEPPANDPGAGLPDEFALPSPWLRPVVR